MHQVLLALYAIFVCLMSVNNSTVRGCLLPDAEALNACSLEQIQILGRGRLDGWINKLVWGDNLESLKLLMQDSTICGQVRLIYIDPPYATNQEFRIGIDRVSTVSSSYEDQVAYEDTLSGEAYIDSLRERLILLREILSEDGSIYVHVDTKIGHHVKVLMDEIFGAKNFINHIVRIKCNPKNFARKGYGNIHDMILFYSKGPNYVWNESREIPSEAEIRRLFPKVDRYGRRYTTTPLHAPGETQNGVTGMPWRGLLPPKGRHWRYAPEELERLDREGLIEWSANGNPRKIIYADEARLRGKKRQDIWDFKDPAYPVYPTQKNLQMLKVIIQASSNPDDIVLDCYAGSGTTLVAAEELGRRWIGIDSSEASIQIAQKRLLSLREISGFAIYRVRNSLS